jgi:hypothetical protein
MRKVEKFYKDWKKTSSYLKFKTGTNKQMFQFAEEFNYEHQNKELLNDIADRFVMEEGVVHPIIEMYFKTKSI